MGLTIQSLTELEQADYDAARQLILTMLQEAYPYLELGGGAMDALLVQPAAVLQAANQKNMDRIRQANSLQAIEADPTLADDTDEEVVDRLASNYQLTRIAASPAVGQIAIILDTLAPVVIGSGEVFTAPAGQEFAADSSFTGKLDEDEVISDTDRLISSVGDGTYVMTIDATAVANGISSNIARSTALTTTAVISNFVRAYAAADFVDGLDTETTTDLIARVRTSWNSRSPATRAGMEGLFRAQEGYEDLIAVSTLGFGDTEQRRNHSILPIAMPGRVDSYVRTQGPWEAKLLTKTATLMAAGANPAYGHWQCTITRDEGPIYQVNKITLPVDAEDSGAPTFATITATRGYDVSAGSTPSTQFLPDVTSATEAAFSRYQTLILRFYDILTPISGLTIGVSTKDYSIALRSLPGIAALQDAVCVRTTRSLVGDVLVKAPVPAFVTATIDIEHTNGATEVDEDAVKDAVAAAINTTGFIGKLTGSVLTSAAQAVLPAGNTVTAVDMDGTIVNPDGTTDALSSATALQVTNDAAAMVTNRTVCFFSSPASITLVVDDVDTPEV